MLRALSTLALSFLLLTGATAQSVPTPASKKTAVQADRAAKRAAKKAQRLAHKKAVAAKKTGATAAVNDGWPPLGEGAPLVASAASDPTYGAAPDESAYGQGNVYAGPGMPVNIRTTSKRVPYSVRQPRKTALPKTTLSGGK